MKYVQSCPSDLWNVISIGYLLDRDEDNVSFKREREKTIYGFHIGKSYYSQ